jgi:hypothetical protein
MNTAMRHRAAPILPSALVTVLAVVCLLSGGCEAAPPSAATPPSSAPAAKAVVPDGPLGVVFGEYEAMRVALAADTLAPLPASMTKLSAASEALTASSAPAASALSTATAALSTSLSASPPKIADVRVAYGEVSKALVDVIAKDPALQAGRFLFECPMAKGYQRWFQLKPEMENPYMGTRMLTCGSTIASWADEVKPQ